MNDEIESPNSNKPDHLVTYIRIILCIDFIIFWLSHTYQTYDENTKTVAITLISSVVLILIIFIVQEYKKEH